MSVKIDLSDFRSEPDDIIYRLRRDIEQKDQRIAALEGALREVTEILDGETEYHQQGMGCGLEDRNITDRYDAMQHGWDSAIERAYSEHVNPALEVARAALTGTGGDVWRHKKRGAEYKLLKQGVLQTDKPLLDNSVLITYEGTDGNWYHRTPEEFHDGRFERVAPPAQTAGERG